MVPSDIVYCDQCGGASPHGSTACQFCGAALPPPRTATRAPTAAAATPPAAPASGPDDDPWAALTEPDPTAADGDAWVDPEHLPWRADPAAEPGPTLEQGAAAHEAFGPPTYDEVPVLPDAGWAEGDRLIDPDELGSRRGLPGWAWVASVVVLGSLLGIGAYVVVDRTDDGAVRTTDPTTTSSSTTSSSTSTTSTTSTTIAPTTPAPTVPVVPATPPATAPVTGPPTVPGAVTVPTTIPTTPAPTTVAPPTTPAPTTAAPPTTPAPTTPPTPAPTAAPGGTVPGDLGVPGIPMSQPACDGQYVTFLASVKDTTGPAMHQALTENFPGASYLRTDQSCPSINLGASDGSPLYRIFVGPFPDLAQACAARAQSTQGSFIKRLSTTDSPTHVVTCPDPPPA